MFSWVGMPVGEQEHIQNSILYSNILTIGKFCIFDVLVLWHYPQVCPADGSLESTFPSGLTSLVPL